MARRFVVALSTTLALASPAAAQPAPATAQASVSVPREVLDRYTGRYAINGTTVTVGVTDDNRLTAPLAGQPAGPPLRAINATEFSADQAGVLITFEGEGPKAPRIRSRFNGGEVVGLRLPDTAAATTAPFPASLDAAARKGVITALGAALRERYIYPDVGAKAAAKLDAALAAGEYDSLSDPGAFAARLHADVEAIAHDKHLRIAALSAPPPAPPPGAEPPPIAEAGVVRADKLAGGIGYIEVSGFPPPQAFKPALDRAMNALAGSKALIIDIRRNGGGAPPSVNYLVSYLIAPDRVVHVNDIVSRVPGKNEFTREVFNSERTPVSFAGVPVYVLTSGRTFSGGEGFAYDVKTHKLGTLVGEVSGGGANPTGPVPLPSGIQATIPFGRAENPVTKTNWEGHGVDPDIAVPAREALRTALEKLGHPPAAEIAAASRERVFAPRSTPLPGTEAVVRQLVSGLASGSPDYAAMSPQFAEVTRQQLPALRGLFTPLGELKSLTFRGPGPAGGDAYDAVFGNGSLMVSVALGPDGKIDGSAIMPGSPRPN